LQLPHEEGFISAGILERPAILSFRGVLSEDTIYMPCAIESYSSRVAYYFVPLIYIINYSLDDIIYEKLAR